MPVQPTYPGVYIEELPSGVRTISGVSTSTAVFIGRTKQGPLKQPVLCLSWGDFERAFSAEYANSELARQVRLFFDNGGSRCYVVRIADNPKNAGVTLKNEAGADTLEVAAKSPGGTGDKIRLAVTYRGTQPESGFNLEVFRWGQDAGGNLVKLDQEVLPGLSMNPDSPRYVGTWGEQSSKLVTFKDKKLAAVDGFSQSGRPVPARNDAIFRAQWRLRLGKESQNGANRFRISVAGGAFVEADLSALDFTQDPLDTDAKAAANLATRIEEEINKVLTGPKVKVTLEDGPAGKAGADNEKTKLLKIASTKADVVIEPAGANDLAGPLMLGGSQGGYEVSAFAANRPAPNGIVFVPAKSAPNGLNAFAGQKQSAFNTLVVGGVDVGLGNALKTVPADPEARMYQDNAAATGNSSGVREKLGILAAKVNEKRQADPSFPWTAEVWGSRLALLPVGAADNSVGAVSTKDGDGVNLAASFLTNTSYYSLGASGAGGFQTPGQAGDDGGAPKLPDYRAAFDVLRKEVEIFNLLLLPADAGQSADERAALWGPASAFCQERRAFLLIDAPAWANVQEATHPANGVNKLRQGVVKDHAAVFYPRVTVLEGGAKVHLGASGAIAGLMARIDSSRGVWKAPAGTEADIRGIVGLEQRFSDPENGVLNPRAINTLRIFSSGIVNWGARTLDGDDDFGSQWKYIPVRRLALYIEESLFRGTQWVVFEPNDEPLWAQIRLNVGAFMHTLFRQGAFQGRTPREAYLVKCDRETTTQDDINRGIVNVVVGFAPLKPAEFVILKIQQLAGQIQA